MRGTPTRLWTCDKCGRQETALVGSAPAGWRFVRSEVLPETRTPSDKPFDAEWCQTCCAVYLAPLERQEADDD